MEHYFNHDIIANILHFLNKNDSFNLLNISTNMTPLRKILYGKYLFDHNKLNNDDLKPFIKYLKSDNVYNFIPYANLYSLETTNVSKPINNLPETLSLLIIINANGGNDLCIEQLPINLTNLEINNCPYDIIDLIENLPRKLEELKITSNRFNHPINNLPNTLKFLMIDGHDFCQSLDNLPENLETLIIYTQMLNHPYDKLPKKLKKFWLSSDSFNETFDYLPDSLENLEIYNDNFNGLLNHLPKNLRHFGFLGMRHNQQFNNLPNTLKSLELYFCDDFNQSLNHLPNALESFSIQAWAFNQPLDNLPDTLRSLNITCWAFDQSLEKLPEKLQSLKIECANLTHNPILPNTLKSYTKNKAVII
jgi:hypothetical protein